MKAEETKYWHDIEEIAENYVEYKEKLEEEGEEEINQILGEFIEENIEQSDWFLDESFAKVFQYTRHKEYLSGSTSAFCKAKNCMEDDIYMVIESFEEVEYEEISEDDSLDLMEIDFDL